MPELYSPQTEDPLKQYILAAKKLIRENLRNITNLPPVEEVSYKFKTFLDSLKSGTRSRSRSPPCYDENNPSCHRYCDDKCKFKRNNN